MASFCRMDQTGVDHLFGPAMPAQIVLDVEQCRTIEKQVMATHAISAVASANLLPLLGRGDTVDTTAEQTMEQTEAEKGGS